jgi:rod shape determining protein RodA
MNKILTKEIDWLLIIHVLVLVLLSLVTLFSLNVVFFRGQFFLFLISFIFFLFFSQINYKIMSIYSKPIYIFSLVALTLVLILGIESRGAVRWIEIAGFRLQLSEVFKPFLSISLAVYLSRIRNLNFSSFLSVFGLLTPIALLIFFQPDLGNAIIYGLIVLLTLIYMGFSFKYFAVIFAPFVLAAPIMWEFLHDYQRQRVLTFINPSLDPLGTSYNVIQSIIAVGSGQVTGRGLGQGLQSQLKFLPERQTDFIFASSAEEIGFFGCIVILGLYGFLLWRMIYIMRQARDDLGMYIVGGVFFMFLPQVVINIGMNIGILPVTGIPLPFLSYGGSSLLVMMTSLGIVQSVARHSKNLHF